MEKVLEKSLYQIEKNDIKHRIFCICFFEESQRSSIIHIIRNGISRVFY